MKRTALLLAMLVCITSVSSPGAMAISELASLSSPEHELSAGAISLEHVLKRRDITSKFIKKTQKGERPSLSSFLATDPCRTVFGIPPVFLGTSYDLFRVICLSTGNRIFHARE